MPHFYLIKWHTNSLYQEQKSRRLKMFRKLSICFILALAVNLQARNTATQTVRITIIRPNQMTIVQNQSKPTENTLQWNTSDTQKKITVSMTDKNPGNTGTRLNTSSSQVSKVISSSVENTSGFMKVKLGKDQIGTASQVTYTLLDT